MKKAFDYFYEKNLRPACEYVAELAECTVDLLLNVALWLTVPIWIIPYLIIKQKEERKNEK